VAGGRRVLALVRDVMFLSRIRQALPADDWDLEIVGRLPALDAALVPGPPDLVLVDLASRGLPWEEMLASMRRHPNGADVPVLAFGPHMDLGLRERALAAGAARVIANSTLVTELPALARRLANRRR
jgi:DNA-binding NarL/FixJ family response regulator